MWWWIEPRRGRKLELTAQSSLIMCQFMLGHFTVSVYTNVNTCIFNLQPEWTWCQKNSSSFGLDSSFSSFVTGQEWTCSHWSLVGATPVKLLSSSSVPGSHRTYPHMSHPTEETHMENRGLNQGLGRHRFKTCLYLLLCMGPWLSYLTSLSLSFLISKVPKIVKTTLSYYCEIQPRKVKGTTSCHEFSIGPGMY